MKGAHLFIVMGVSGSGKTTMAHLLASAHHGQWLDADNFHSAGNKSKMHAGIPLTDADRLPWLKLLNRELRRADAKEEPVFLACSALKRTHRVLLTAGLPRSTFIYLKGSFDLIRTRLAGRKNHFMPPGLLESQFVDLEEPDNSIVLDVTKAKEELLEDFCEQVKRRPKL